jgi:hypothetical protein
MNNENIGSNKFGLNLETVFSFNISWIKTILMIGFVILKMVITANGRQFTSWHQFIE